MTAETIRHPAPMADDDLPTMRSLQAGEEAALVTLMDRYREPIFRLAFRYVGNAVDAATLTEEVFAKAYFNARRFRPTASVRSWLFAIAANHCRDFLRRQKRHRGLRSIFAGSPSQQDQVSTLADRLAAPDPHGAESVESQENLERLEAAIRALPEKLRFPFIFCVLEEHSQDEAAEVLGTTRKTVELRVYRARKELQKRLAAGVD